ncbi:hypothetical protein GQ42DRAFT_181872 [Ramicandelaber brevisporus]|nr:hypothetical protein GQ42DRAFT_181872 [Ramicandelaber brevisporus]
MLAKSSASFDASVEHDDAPLMNTAGDFIAAGRSPGEDTENEDTAGEETAGEETACEETAGDGGTKLDTWRNIGACDRWTTGDDGSDGSEAALSLCARVGDDRADAGDAAGDVAVDADAATDGAEDFATGPDIVADVAEIVTTVAGAVVDTAVTATGADSSGWMELSIEHRADESNAPYADSLDGTSSMDGNVGVRGLDVAERVCANCVCANCMCTGAAVVTVEVAGAAAGVAAGFVRCALDIFVRKLCITRLVSDAGIAVGIDVGGCVRIDICDGGGIDAGDGGGIAAGVAVVVGVATALLLLMILSLFLTLRMKSVWKRDLQEEAEEEEDGGSRGRGGRDGGAGAGGGAGNGGGRWSGGGSDGALVQCLLRERLSFVVRESVHHLWQRLWLCVWLRQSL